MCVKVDSYSFYWAAQSPCVHTEQTLQLQSQTEHMRTRLAPGQVRELRVHGHSQDLRRTHRLAVLLGTEQKQEPDAKVAQTQVGQTLRMGTVYAAALYW